MNFIQTLFIIAIINLIIGLIFIESDKEETRNTGMIIFAPSFLLFFIGVLIALWIYCF